MSKAAVLQDPEAVAKTKLTVAQSAKMDIAIVIFRQHRHFIGIFDRVTTKTINTCLRLSNTKLDKSLMFAANAL